MKRIYLALLALFLVGCGSFAGILPTSAPPALTPTLPSSATASDGTLAPVVTPLLDMTPTPDGPVTLVVWLPPEFDPAGETAAAKLLRARLDEFLKRQSDVRLDVRIKTLKDEPGGIYNSLVTASTAAPGALPDIVAMPHEMFHTAALKGLLRPLEGLVDAMNSTDWYAYARQLAFVQSTIYGLPFAGDSLVMLYRSTEVGAPPTDWGALLKSNTPFAFPLADPKALYTLALYQALGGSLQDDEGRAILQPEPLTQVLSLYQQAETAGLFPSWMIQLQDDSQAWEAFQERRASLLITWASRYLMNPKSEFAIALIPTADGAPFTLASGWVWGMATSNPDKQALSIRLAEFLAEPAFLSAWTYALGYLPVRPSTLEAWTNAGLRAVVGQASQAAHLYPPPEIMINLGSALKEAALQVARRQAVPSTAAQQAVQTLSGAP